MLLTVADTPEEVETVRKMFVYMRYFTYCATTANMLEAARKYPLSDLLIVTEAVNDDLIADVAQIRVLYPEINVFLVSDNMAHSLEVRRQLSTDISSEEILFEILYYSKPSPNSVDDFHENLIVKGLLFNTYIHGWIGKFSDNDAFLLRYLAEIYPRRASMDELCSLCFGFGKKASVGALKARISRINQRAMHSLPPLSRPIVTFKAKEGGYQIDF